MSNKILVLGSTGKTGKRVAERLQNLQIPTRLGSRKGQPSFNWDEPGNWEEVLTGIETVYITFQPDVAIPRAFEKIKLFTEAAKLCKVNKLVLLSGRGEDTAEACEQLVIQSGIEWTIIRANWFMQNFSESIFLESILNNELVIPTAKSPEPFVDVDDIADVAVAVLMNKQHSYKTYVLSGPAAISFESATAQIATALNRPIAYTEISINEYADILKSYQLPDETVDLIQYLFTEVLDGRNETISNDIENILGRKPTSFKEYVLKTVKTGVWETQ